MAILSSHITATLIGYGPLDTINLVSATALDSLRVELAFNKSPSGTVLSAFSYTITPPGGSAAVSVASVVLGAVPPGEVYPFSCILTFAAQGTGGASYGVTVAGIIGPDDEPLGVDSATFTALATLPVVSSVAATLADIVVGFSADMDPATVQTAGDWDVRPTAGGSPLALASATLVDDTVTIVPTDPIALDVEYTVTAPAAAADLAHNLIDPAHDTGTFEILSAAARAWFETEQSAAVQFTEAVVQSSAYDTGDALNPACYTITRSDGTVYDAEILCIEPWTDMTGTADATRVLLRFSGYVAREYQGAVFTVAGVSAVADGTLPTFSVTADGVAAPLPLIGDNGSAIPDSITDLRSYVTDTKGEPGGTLAVGTSGDYEIARSQETIKKLVYRVLSTQAGSFAHLPTWGAGAALKGLGRASELQRIARNGRAGILAIPGVVDASVSAVMESGGILVVTARVKTKKFGTTSYVWSPSTAGE